MLAIPLPHARVASAAKCTTRQIRRVKSNLLKYGTVRAPKIVHQDRKYKMIEEMEEIY